MRNLIPTAAICTRIRHLRGSHSDEFSFTQVPCVIPLVIINWFTFPLLAGICGILWPLVRVSDAFQSGCACSCHSAFDFLTLLMGLSAPLTLTFHLQLKIGYFVGYGYFGASGRLWGAGAYLPQLALYGITVWSAVVLFQGADAY